MTDLVVGFGNRWRGDDAAGLAVAERLAERLAGRLPGVTVRACERPPPDLFAWWEPASRVVLVDAAAQAGAPGSVHRFDAVAAPLPCELLRVSTHGGGVAEAVELARALGGLPRELVVFALEGASFEHGAPLSAPARRAVDEVVEALLAELGGSPCTRPG